MVWKLNKDKCVECGACVSVCPFSALELEKNGLVHYPDKCTLCGICERACPVTAIKVEKEAKAAGAAGRVEGAKKQKKTRK